jgi:hypothetical protein
MCPSIVGRCDGSKPFLTGSIPLKQAVRTLAVPNSQHQEGNIRSEA